MAHCHFEEDLMRLRHINRQMRLLDVRLQLLRDRLCACGPLRLGLPCCCLSPPCHKSCHNSCHKSCCRPCSKPSCGTCCRPCYKSCCGPCCRPLLRKYLTAKMDTERRAERRKRLCMLLHSTCCPSNLACVDMKGFDPSDVNVTVRDGKVTVAAERKEEHHTCLGRASNYRKFVKEFNLPPGVTDDEVTYSVESSSLTEIPPKCCAPTCCTYLCDC